MPENSFATPGSASADVVPAPQGTTSARLPGVSVVVPVLNEERHLSEAVARILGQDYQGDLEVVLALGPSKDRTDAVAAELAAADPRVRSVRNPTGRTPAGLNAAIGASHHPIVVRVDGHGLLAPDYIATAVALLERTGAANVGGIMAAEGVTDFQKAVARAMTSVFGVGGARFHTGGQAGPAETVYLGVFRREVLESLGGYDESFLRAQDWELNHRLREAGHLVYFSPQLSVTYRPRPNLSALGRQYFHYGRWRRVVMRQHPGTVSLRYLAAPVTVLGCLLGVLAAPLWPWTLLAPLGYAAGVLVAAAVTARGLPWRAALQLPLVYASMHWAWGIGFLTSPRLLGRPETVPVRGGGPGGTGRSAGGPA